MPLPDFPKPENNLGLPVKYLVKRPPVFVEPVATVAEAARTMREALIGSVLVADDPPGIVTDRDLCSRVLAAGLGPETPVRQVMTRPLKTLDSDAPVFKAMHLMLEEHIHHLALVEEGKIVALISSTDLLRHEATGAFYLRRTLESVEDPTALAHYSSEVAGTVQALFRGGLGAVQIGQIVSSLNDALVKRLVGLAEQALGPAPTDFAWIVFGSEGRLEQTLLTDQDNALIYGEESEAARAYFKLLGERVVNGLDSGGLSNLHRWFHGNSVVQTARAMAPPLYRLGAHSSAPGVVGCFDLLRLSPCSRRVVARATGRDFSGCANGKGVYRSSGTRRFGLSPAAGVFQPVAQR